MLFEWDEDKNRKNRQKHGIWFEEAQSVFDDDHAKVVIDASAEHEIRYIIIGYNAFGLNLIVIHCYRQNEEVIRIILARKSTKKERLFYEKGI